jgi:hypothetical protein
MLAWVNTMCLALGGWLKAEFEFAGLIPAAFVEPSMPSKLPELTV